MKKVKAVKIVAMIFPGAVIAILLLFGLGETIGGDWSGLGHLIQAAPIVLLMWLGWKRPLWGGTLLLVIGILSFLRFSNDFQDPGWLAPFLILSTPLLLSGLLLLSAAGLERQAA